MQKKRSARTAPTKEPKGKKSSPSASKPTAKKEEQETKANEIQPTSQTSEKTPKQMQKVLLFKVDLPMNDRGSCNAYEWLEWPEVNLKHLQEAIGGRIESLPLPKDPKMVCYFHEEGFLQNLPTNDLGTRVLVEHFGLRPSTISGFSYWGPMLVTSTSSKKGLSEKQITQLQSALDKDRMQAEEETEEE